MTAAVLELRPQGAELQADDARAVAARERAKLQHLRDEFAMRAKGRELRGEEASEAARSAEWRALSLDLRCALIILAGIEGGEEWRLAGREWRELPPPERAALRAVMRRVHAELGRAWALFSRA